MSAILNRWVPLALVACLSTQATAQSAAVPVTVAQATQADVPIVLKAIGTVQAFQSVVIRARVDGTLDKVVFVEGQHVRPGDLLAQLDPRPYQAVLDQALAKKAADEAMLSMARSDLVRYNDLAQSQAASRQKLDQTRAQMAQADATVRGDEATIAAAQLNLAFTRMVSPIDGRAGLRQIDPGNFIRAADPTSPGLVTVAQLQPIALIFTVPQDALPKVQTAMRRGSLPVSAYSSDDRTKLADGALLTLDSGIDPLTGTIKLKAVFANAEDTLWPGQFVNVRMQLDIRQGSIAVPAAGVQRGPGGLYVFLVKPDSTVVVTPVEVVQDDGTTVVVAKGLQPGDRVVVAGQSRLTNGTRISANDTKPAG